LHVKRQHRAVSAALRQTPPPIVGHDTDHLRCVLHVKRQHRARRTVGGESSPPPIAYQTLLSKRQSAGNHLRRPSRIKRQYRVRRKIGGNHVRRPSYIARIVSEGLSAGDHLRRVAAFQTPKSCPHGQEQKQNTVSGANCVYHEVRFSSPARTMSTHGSKTSSAPQRTCVRHHSVVRDRRFGADASQRCSIQETASSLASVSAR